MIRPVSWLALILFAAIFTDSCSKNVSESGTPINREMVQAPVDPETLVKPVVDTENTAEQINKENFDKIKNGMTLLDVEIIIAGTSRKVTSKTENNKKNETYRWETSDRAKYIEVSFVDEKVIGKSQKGLM